MTLILTNLSQEKPVSLQAPNEMSVFKVLTKASTGTHHSPLHNFKYQLGTINILKRNELLEAVKHPYINSWNVLNGLHSFTNIDDALMFTRWLNRENSPSENYIIFKGIIPKNARYYKGQSFFTDRFNPETKKWEPNFHDAIVSDSLIPTEILWDNFNGFGRFKKFLRFMERVTEDQ